eukprot:GHVU01039809.1.p1 GENE.GHVU01039809.1~~GHVU01039809.1.p1  ORF type:complete len:368 (-),score=39.71 GHVU01039809.1:654-1757(-)
MPNYEPPPAYCTTDGVKVYSDAGGILQQPQQRKEAMHHLKPDGPAERSQYSGLETMYKDSQTIHNHSIPEIDGIPAKMQDSTGLPVSASGCDDSADFAEDGFVPEEAGAISLSTPCDPHSGAELGLENGENIKWSVDRVLNPYCDRLMNNTFVGDPGDPILDRFWRQQTAEIQNLTVDDFRTHTLPLARIKKIMKLDDNVKMHQMISAETTVLFAKACELFILELTHRAWVCTESCKRRTLQRSDISMAMTKSDMFDFLIDIVPREDVVASKPQPMRWQEHDSTAPPEQMPGFSAWQVNPWQSWQSHVHHHPPSHSGYMPVRSPLAVGNQMWPSGSSLTNVEPEAETMQGADARSSSRLEAHPGLNE